MANNSSNNNKSAATGIVFSDLLTITFIVLKLCGVIDWEWIWVLSPLWISTVIGLLIVIGLFIVVFWFGR